YSDNETMIKNPEVLAIYKKEINKVNPMFAHYEQIKNFGLVADEWSIENNILTPTLKVKRKEIQSRYKEQIEYLFA
ncbi:MAG: long-chain fatty acid--CoA ligase, partial [Bacteroidales bacterium]|nr:long-chain fatty acid--CoA ligase [Bacteroidales bacterium]